jgi:hypothetical protein
LAIYTSLPLQDAVIDFNAIPLSHAEFLGQAEEILAESASLSAEELRSRVIGLPTPSAPMLTAAAGHCRQVLHRADAGELVARLFAEHSVDAHLYGLLTFRTATDAERAGPPPTAPTVLACPIAIDVDLLAWLELARRCLGWRQACPSFAWIEEPTAMRPISSCTSWQSRATAACACGRLRPSAPKPSRAPATCSGRSWHPR